MCVHTYHWPYGYPFIMLHPCQWVPKDPWCSLRHFCYCCMKCWRSHVTKTTTCTSLTHVQFFSSMNQNCVHQKWNSHPSWCCHSQCNACGFISLILHNLRICSFWCSSSQRKELLWLTLHWSILPSNTWRIWMSTQTCWYVFTWSCWCHLELQRTRKPLFFFYWLFFFIIKFNYVAKMQKSSILSWVVMVGLIVFWLPPF